MFLARFTFKPALIPTVATATMVTITALMGTWQLNRAAEKAEMQREYDMRATTGASGLSSGLMEPTQVAYRRFELSGTFDRKWEIYLDNKIHNGVAGYHVVTPLRTPNSEIRVLINRGWIAATRDRNTLPGVATPAQAVRIVGMAQVPSKKILELSSETVQGHVWQNLNLERYQKTVPFVIQPFVLLQESPSDDGLTREWPRPDYGRSKHLGYAFQWYALSVVLIIIYVVVNAKRIR